MKRFTIPIGGHKFVCSLVRPQHPIFDGDPTRGVAMATDSRLYFATGCSQSTYEDTFIHEAFGHAAFEVSGVSQMLREECGFDAKQAAKFEEDAVRKLVLAWHPLLSHFQFKFPKMV